MGFRWLVDLSISFLSSRTGEKRNGAAQKTEIHSMMGAVDLKDLLDHRGREQVRYEYNGSEQNIEQ
jgi:hypothetical protein